MNILNLDMSRTAVCIQSAMAAMAERAYWASMLWMLFHFFVCFVDWLFVWRFFTYEGVREVAA